MAKVTLDNIASGYDLSKVNDNFQKIEDELNDKVLYRDNPEGEVNQMQDDLDMNSHRILNLPTPVANGEATNKGYVDTVTGAGYVNQALTAATSAATSASQAASSASSASTSATQAALYLSSSFKNRVINGDMSVWQRGYTFSTGLGALTYTADRWIAYTTGASLTAFRSGGDGINTYCLAFNGAVGNTVTNVAQRIEGSMISHLVGRTVTLSAKVYGTNTFTPAWTVNSANSLDNFSTTTAITGDYFSAVPGGAWTTVSCTFTVTSAMQNGLEIVFSLGATVNGTTKGIMEVQLEDGTAKTLFERRPYALEDVLCRRYFEVIEGVVITTAGIWKDYYYKVIKRVVPTLSNITFSGGTGATFTSLSVNYCYQEAVHSMGSRFTAWASSEL